MEPQNLGHADYAAIGAWYTNPFAEVYCPRCGNRMKYVVKNRFDSLGNLYHLECTNTPKCFYFSIPPTVTPECIRWQEPDKVNPEEIDFNHCCYSCRVSKHCAVERGKAFKEKVN